jgi:hypothetical protein
MTARIRNRSSEAMAVPPLFSTVTDRAAGDDNCAVIFPAGDDVLFSETADLNVRGPEGPFFSDKTEKSRLLLSDGLLQIVHAVENSHVLKRGGNGLPVRTEEHGHGANGAADQMIRKAVSLFHPDLLRSCTVVSQDDVAQFPREDAKKKERGETAVISDNILKGAVLFPDESESVPGFLFRKRTDVQGGDKHKGERLQNA